MKEEIGQCNLRYGWESAEALSAHAYTLPAIKCLLPEGTLTILDAGCGNGYIASQLAAMGHEVTGVDASEDGLQFARKAHPVKCVLKSIPYTMISQTLLLKRM